LLQLLQPIWLFALAGLSVPVIIHLWNQRPGKTLLVGSIALVTASTLSNTRKVRLSEWWLLLLRCLLFTVITLALAGPVWKQKIIHNEKGWVLLPPHTAAVAYQQFKPTIDSLLAEGYQLHYFTSGFAKATLRDATELKDDTVHVQTLSYRAITDMLQQTVDADLPLYVFTDNYLQHFGGERNTAALNLHWQTYTPRDTTALTTKTKAALKVAIFSGAQKEDGQYIRAAIEAIRSYTKKEIIITLAASAGAIPADQDWLFWLSADSIPQGIAAAHVLHYAKGTPVADRSFVLPAANSSFAAVALYKAVMADTADKREGTVYWKDAFGQPLLLATEKQHTVYYSLYTHIDPVWNALPWSSSFPQLIYQLLYPSPAESIITGNAMIDSNQLLPLPADREALSGKLPSYASVSLSGTAWMLSLLLLLAERCVSFFHRKKGTNETH